MKAKRIVLVLLAWLAIGFWACNEDDQDNSGGPGKAVIAAFNNKYPGVASVEWDSYGNYDKADFTYQSIESDAWFYKDGTWLLTISQVAYASLPQSVSQAVASGIYAGWNPDPEAKILEPALESKIYIVEVSKPGEVDRELYYTSEGWMRKEVNEEYDRDELPVWMNSFLQQKYPQALLLQGEKILDGRFSVYLLDGKHFATVWFYRNQKWEYTSWIVEQQDVPAVVLDVLKGEAYQDFLIRNIEYRQTSSGDYYYFDLYREGSVDIKIKITPKGQIVLN